MTDEEINDIKRWINYLEPIPSKEDLQAEYERGRNDVPTGDDQCSKNPT